MSEPPIDFGKMPVVKASRFELGKAAELLCPECGGDLIEAVKGAVADCKRCRILFHIEEITQRPSFPGGYFDEQV